MPKRLCNSLISTPSRLLLLLLHDHPSPSARPFSTSSRNAVGVRRMAGRGSPKAQPSMSLAQKAAMKRMTSSGQALDYIGIIQDTFVPPTGQNRPSIFSDWRGRRKLLKYHVKSWITLMQSRFMAFWLVKPRLKLETHKAAHVAKGLYEGMYHAFAEGEAALGPMQAAGKLSPGLLSSLKGRIAQRPPNTHMRWKLHKYVGTPQCVSFKFAMPDMKSPNTERMGIIQAVVRIKSQQSLLSYQRRRARDPADGKMVIAEVPVDRDGKEIVPFDEQVEEGKNMKTMVEYFVIERTLIKGVLGEWRAWGTTEETTLAQIKKAERAKAKALFGGGQSPV